MTLYEPTENVGEYFFGILPNCYNSTNPEASEKKDPEKNNSMTATTLACPGYIRGITALRDLSVIDKVLLAAERKKLEKLITQRDDVRYTSLFSPHIPLRLAAAIAYLVKKGQVEDSEKLILKLEKKKTVISHIGIQCEQNTWDNKLGNNEITLVDESRYHDQIEVICPPKYGICEMNVIQELLLTGVANIKIDCCEVLYFCNDYYSFEKTEQFEVTPTNTSIKITVKTGYTERTGGESGGRTSSTDGSTFKSESKVSASGSASLSGNAELTRREGGVGGNTGFEQTFTFESTKSKTFEDSWKKSFEHTVTRETIEHKETPRSSFLRTRVYEKVLICGRYKVYSGNTSNERNVNFYIPSDTCRTSSKYEILFKFFIA